MMPFSSPYGERLFRRVLSYMEETGIASRLFGGVLLALSGGADSVFLTVLFSYLSKRDGFPLYALHVHHHIRGEEADRDATFCRELAARLAVPFSVCNVNVPQVAALTHRGVEDTARILRYKALQEELRGRRLAVIATAHHATDHMETVLQKILRGGGAAALLGIRPQNGVRISPLLCLTRDEIVRALREEGITFVDDSSNSDMRYTRNYLRHRVLPLLHRITPTPEKAFLRLSEALSHDASFLKECTERAMAEAPQDARGASVTYLASLHEAVRRRVLIRLYEQARGAEAFDLALTHEQLSKLSLLIKEGRQNFSLSVPRGLIGQARDGFFSFCEKKEEKPFGRIPLQHGINRLPTSFTVTLKEENEVLYVTCSSKFYKIDTDTAISSAIIKGNLYVRPRLAGDTYSFRGHTHTLKKLLNEKKIPIGVREKLPILCDEEGILWVPFCPVREKVARA